MFRLELGTHTAIVGNGCPGGDDTAVFRRHVHGRAVGLEALLNRIAES